MADLISSNDEQQAMAKQVEAIAEAAAQRDSQIAQMLNLVPKAAALSTAASRAISFTKKTWVDDPTSGTPITAADMNRLEQAIVDLNTTLTSVQDSLSHVVSDQIYALSDVKDVTVSAGGVTNVEYDFSANITNVLIACVYQSCDIGTVYQNFFISTKFQNGSSKVQASVHNGEGHSVSVPVACSVLGFR